MSEFLRNDQSDMALREFDEDKDSSKPKACGFCLLKFSDPNLTFWPFESYFFFAARQEGHTNSGPFCKALPVLNLLGPKWYLAVWHPVASVMLWKSDITTMNFRFLGVKISIKDVQL